MARGKRPADLILRGGSVVNVFTGEAYKANVAIYNKLIAGVGDYYQEGCEVYDFEGFYLIPGLIDAHVHIESSMLSPAEYARAVLPYGTTTIICDPHEIANVMGLEGIRYVLNASCDIPLNLFVTASSCVPATHLETSGAALSSKEIEELLQWERVVGLAEMMNVPGVLNGNMATLEKLLLAGEMGRPIDGHSPFLSGKDLNAYIASGVRSDHEVTSREEAIEKLRLGMYIMIREGSVARNMETLLPVVTQANYRRFMFVTDDEHPQDILRNGHMDHILRKAVRLGMPPVMALSMVTINPANAFMRKDIGAIAPGYCADIVAVNNLTEFKVHTVFKDGRAVVRDERLIVDVPHFEDESVRKTMRVKDLNPERFKIKIRGNRIRVIELIRGQIYTRHLIENVCTGEDGEVKADPSKDLLKIAVIERHNATGNVGLGFVRGFGLREGSLASSVAHDSHNIIVVGTNDMDMYIAVQKIIEPFIKLSFLALPVIPELKITDRGLVDVKRFEIVGIEP